MNLRTILVSIPDELKILDGIVTKYNLFDRYESSLIIIKYNDKKHFELKLLNYIRESLIYNTNLVDNELIQNSIATQITKLLHLAFDLKASEN